MGPSWFVFDIGNVLLKLAYERVIARVCAESAADRDRLIEVMEGARGYRDLERGAITFDEFHLNLRETIGYRGSRDAFRRTWSDFFDGPTEGIEELLEKVRGRYRVAFLSNSNEVHAEVIPRQFPMLFRKDDRIVFSHLHKCAKPDVMLYERALQIIGSRPHDVIYTDDLHENVVSARNIGMIAYEFESARRLEEELLRDGYL